MIHEYLDDIPDLPATKAALIKRLICVAMITDDDCDVITTIIASELSD